MTGEKCRESGPLPNKQGCRPRLFFLVDCIRLQQLLNIATVDKHGLHRWRVTSRSVVNSYSNKIVFIVVEFSRILLKN